MTQADADADANASKATSSQRLAKELPSSLAGAHVVIWGIGIHGGGLAAARFCAAEGARVSILDRNTPNDLAETAAICAAKGWTWHTGQLRHAVTRQADVIIASPAVSPAVLEELPEDAAPVIGADALFFHRHRGRRIAITGTKGKSTTAHMTGILLDMPVGGNSHTPLLDQLRHYGPDQDLVCELSSFQLWYLQHQQPRFDAALFTSLGQDHLDWHGGLDAYHAAKANLAQWCDTIFADASVRDRMHIGQAASVRYDDDNFYHADGSIIAKRSQLPLPGRHNADNAALALSLALSLGMDPGILGIRLSRVEGLPHRLQCVAAGRQLRFINDSVATTPEATQVALEAIDGPVALILGGRDKGGDYQPLAKQIAKTGTHAVCLAGSPNSLLSSLRDHGIEAAMATDLEQAVSNAIASLDGNDGSVLLSPACASLPPYRDFAERGQHFQKLAIQAVES